MIGNVTEERICGNVTEIMLLKILPNDSTCAQSWQLRLMPFWDRKKLKYCNFSDFLIKFQVMFENRIIFIDYFTFRHIFRENIHKYLAISVMDWSLFEKVKKRTSISRCSGLKRSEREFVMVHLWSLTSLLNYFLRWRRFGIRLFIFKLYLM